MSSHSIHILLMKAAVLAHSRQTDQTDTCMFIERKRNQITVWQHTKTIILQLYTHSHTCCDIQPTICSLCILSAKNNGSVFAAPAGSSRTSAVSNILWCNTDPYWIESGTTIWMKKKKAAARIRQHAYS